MEMESANENQEKTLSATEYLIQKINGSGIKLNLSKEQMKEILDAGKEVQKMAVKYGTNQDIQVDDENTFNGYGTYVVSVNEDNARQLGIKIASRKYGGTFYINNQPFSDFLQEKNFSPYWSKLVSGYKDNSVDKLAHEILSSDVKGNASLEREQNALSTLLSLDLVEYKREQTFLYSVNIPDNDSTNYLLYNNPIGIEHAQKINEQLEKLGTSWRVSRNDIGKNIYFDVLSKHVFEGNQKKSSEFLKNLGYVGMQMDNANYIVFNDKDMSITDRVQFMKDVNGEVYGFAYEGQIYADEDLVNSNVLAHEYTHLWDKYVQNNNPELWQHGKDILKGTSLWQEITEDKNYENLRTDDEILSECHARIVGKMAEQVLERIEKQDGGLTRDRVIDWDKEVSQYIAEEFNIKPELGSENYVSESIKAEYLKEFLSKPMKDLMNEVKIGKEKKILSLEEAQNLYPNIVDLSEEFNNPAPTENEVLEKLRSMVGEVYATATEDKNIQIEGGRRKLSHIYEGDNYKNDFRKKREVNRKLAGNVEKLIHNAEFIEAELPKPEKNKEYLLGMHNYEVPVFVNGHGFMVRLEGEVIKNASDYSLSHMTTKNTLTSEAQLDSNELLLKLQAAKVSNLYVIRKQKPLFKVEQKTEIEEDFNASVKASDIWTELKESLPEMSDKDYNSYKFMVMDYLFQRGIDDAAGFTNSIERNIARFNQLDKNTQQILEKFNDSKIDFDDTALAIKIAGTSNANLYRAKMDLSEQVENRKYLREMEEQGRIIDEGVEQLQANGGMSDAAMEAEIEAQDNLNHDYLDEQGNPHSFDEEPDYDDGQLPLEVVEHSQMLYAGTDKVSADEYIVRIDEGTFSELLPEEIAGTELKENEIPCITFRKSTDLETPDQYLISVFEKDNYSSPHIQTTIEISDQELLRQMKALCDNYSERENEQITNEKQENQIPEQLTNNIELNAEEIFSVLESFSKVNSNQWDVYQDDKIAVYHLIDVTKIKESSREEGLLNLKNYFKTEEFEREKESYLKILEPFINKIVTKGEIKSIHGQDFSGNNVKLTQAFQDELIEKGIVKPEEKFVLINEVEADAKGTKIKPEQPYVTLTIPVNNNGKTEFVATKYFHVSSVEEPQKLEKSEQKNSEKNKNADKDVIIYGKTKVPEFAMITQHGLENFKDMIIERYEETYKMYLLKSENGEKNVRITENTLKELTSEQYRDKSKSYTEETSMAEKMVETQYNDFFQLRDNCANNFRHNLSVFCRKEANSPLDALKIANSLISQMPKDEKRRTKELLNLLRKDGQTVNEVIIETYHEAVKEVPLNEDYLKNKRYEKMIARPMYDTISKKGEKIDRDFNLKIGDTVETAFKVDKNVGSKFSLRKESIYQNCTIVSASKEGNVVTLMDSNKSFYDVPRDTFLKEYAKRQKIENRMEKKVHRQHSMQIDIGR